MKLESLHTLSESLNSRFDSVAAWKKDGDTLTTRGELADEVIELKIELRQFMDRHVWANLAFSRRLDDGSFTQELTGTGKKQSAIFGAVRHELLSQLQQLGERVTIDALVVAAVDDEKRRISFYDKLLTSTLTRLSGWGRTYHETQLAGGTALIVFSDNLDSSTRSMIINAVQQESNKP